MEEKAAKMITSIGSTEKHWIVIAIFFFALSFLYLFLLLYRIRQNRDLRRVNSDIFGKLLNNAAKLNNAEKELKELKEIRKYRK